MTERGFTLRGLARATHYDPGLLSKVLNGQRACSADLAAQLDTVLGAKGGIRQAAARPAAPVRLRVRKSAAVEAIQLAMAGDADSMAVAVDGLYELIRHYAVAVAVEPSAATYGELTAARSFAGTLIRCAPARDRAEVTAAAGWLSSLLAISATDLGDHAAAAVWCSDTERRGTGAANPELMAWAALTRAVIAWYQANPARSAREAQRGYHHAPAGTAARVKLAAQEMRARAMLGDTEGMTEARNRAEAAMDGLGSTPTTGAYSVRLAADPPYTATSLLLTGHYREAAGMTRTLLGCYVPESAGPGELPTNYARTLLILALSAAGMGDADEAASVGIAALGTGRPVWPTMVLAGRLETSLARTAGGSGHHKDFQARYSEARLALPAAGTAVAVGR